MEPMREGVRQIACRYWGRKRAGRAGAGLEPTTTTHTHTDTRTHTTHAHTHYQALWASRATWGRGKLWSSWCTRALWPACGISCSWWVASRHTATQAGVAGRTVVPIF